jgi:hypothetical protein
MGYSKAQKEKTHKRMITRKGLNPAAKLIQ